MYQLERVLDDRLAHHRPIRTPPFADLQARRRRRTGKRLAASGVALAGVAALVVASPVGPVGQTANAPSFAGSPGIPAEISDVAGIRFVLPQDAPDGYTFFATNSTASAEAVDMRQLILRPRRLEAQPVVYICVDASLERDRCPAGTESVQREHDGLPVTITLRGPGASDAKAIWETARLTTDAESSDVF